MYPCAVAGPSTWNVFPATTAIGVDASAWLVFVSADRLVLAPPLRLYRQVTSCRPELECPTPPPVLYAALVFPWITDTEVTPAGTVKVRFWVVAMSRYTWLNGEHPQLFAAGEPTTVTRESLGNMYPSPGFCSSVRGEAPKEDCSRPQSPLA